jgi:23S rRNA pseudouridine2605 synthase
LKRTEPLRLNLFLSRSGLGSRRKCDDLIREQRITVNGALLDTPGYVVQPEDRVACDGEEVNPVDERIYIALNKPSNYLCSNMDSRGRPCAIDLLKDAFPMRLFHVGRLDFRSSGLIFYTNDGEFANKVMHPSNEIEKEYFIEAHEEIPDDFLEKFKKGIKIETVMYKIREFKRISRVKVHLILNEGKNREIRNVFRLKNIPIKKLVRIRIGNISLEGMKPGEFRHLKKKEIDWFLAGIKKDKK